MDPRGAAPGRDRERQALRRQQPGGRPERPAGLVGSRFTRRRAGSTSARCARSTCRTSRPRSRTAEVGSVMCAYNRLERAARLREPHAADAASCAHDWGFRGFVLADYGASKHIGSALKAGLDFEPWPFLDLDGGENLTPAAVQRRDRRRADDPGRGRRRGRRLLRDAVRRRLLRPRGLPRRPLAHRRGGPPPRRAAGIAEAGAVLLRNRTARCRSTRGGSGRWR